MDEIKSARLKPDEKSRRSSYGNKLPNHKNTKLYAKPGYIFIITIVSIFLSEAFLMLVLTFLPPLNTLGTALLDASLLAVCLLPMLYFLVFRPLKIHLNRRKKAEEEKEKLIEKLEGTLAEIKVLRGIIPICASCKKIRDDKGFWQQVEIYVCNHSDATFSHGLCPDCIANLYPQISAQQ